MKIPLLAAIVLFGFFSGCSVFPEIESGKSNPFAFKAPLDLRLTSHYIRTTEAYPPKEYWWYGGREESPGFMMEHRQRAIIVITYYTNSDFERDKSGSAFSFGAISEVFHTDLKDYRNTSEDSIILRKDLKAEDGVYCVVGVLWRRENTEEAFDSDLTAIKDSIQNFRLK